MDKAKVLIGISMESHKLLRKIRKETGVPMNWTLNKLIHDALGNKKHKRKHKRKGEGKHKGEGKIEAVPQ